MSQTELHPQSTLTLPLCLPVLTGLGWNVQQTFHMPSSCFVPGKASPPRGVFVLRLCAQACPGLQVSRLRVKPCQPARFPAKPFLLLFQRLLGSVVCVWMDKCQHSWAAAGMRGETPLKSFPAAAGHRVRWCPLCPCAVTEAALPPHPALGRAELGCETKSSLYSLPESTKGCAWSYQPIDVSVSAWERSGFGE